MTRVGTGGIVPTLALAFLAAVASIAGLFVPGVYGDAALAPAMRGQDLVTLGVLPFFVWFARGRQRGCTRSTLGWLGALSYLLYTYTGAAFAYRWNALFLVYLGLFGGCLFLLVRGLGSLEAKTLQRMIDHGAPRWPVVLYLGAVAAMLAVSELGQIGAALARGEAPELIQRSAGGGNFVYVLDLGVVVPVMLLALHQLRWRRPWGDVLAGMLLVKSAAMGFALLSMTAFAARVGEPTSYGLTFAYATLAIGGLALSAWFLRHCHPSPQCESSGQSLGTIARLVS